MVRPDLGCRPEIELIDNVDRAKSTGSRNLEEKVSIGSGVLSQGEGKKCGKSLL